MGTKTRADYERELQEARYNPSNAGAITIDTLINGWLSITRHDESVWQGQNDLAKLMVPYGGKPPEVWLAAITLATATVGQRVLHPREYEECMAVLRSAGMEWGKEPSCVD